MPTISDEEFRKRKEECKNGPKHTHTDLCAAVGVTGTNVPIPEEYFEQSARIEMEDGLANIAVKYSDADKYKYDRPPTTSIMEILEERQMGWPMGACSLLIEIKDYSGTCGRCGWSFEDHEYLQKSLEFEDDEGNRFWALLRG
jgi:hypothetical protein